MIQNKQWEDPQKVFRKFIESQKLNGCDPVFDLQIDFKLGKLVGKGSISSVSQMTHIQSGYLVAVKTYEKILLRRKSQLMAIHREIFILAKLDHINIMKLYEVLDSSTHVNLVLQHCQGVKLNDFLIKYGTKGRIGINNNVTNYLSESKSKLIFRQIVDAVNYMHSQGVVHRDLRIETIIINENNSKIKLVNFGFATQFDQNFNKFVMDSQDDLHSTLSVNISQNAENTKNRTLICQLQDCYNLGLILFILLTGGLPIWAHIESSNYPKIISPKNSLPLSQNDSRGLDIFSKECQDLISKLFKADLSNQITLQEVLNSEWLQTAKV